MVYATADVMQSRGVNSLLLNNTPPLRFTQMTREIGSELVYADVEHSNKVARCTSDLFVSLMDIIQIFIRFICLDADTVGLLVTPL